MSVTVYFEGGPRAGQLRTYADYRTIPTPICCGPEARAAGMFGLYRDANRKSPSGYPVAVWVAMKKPDNLL